MKWCCVPNPKGRRMPQWMRSAALSNDGVIFVPAAIIGNEMTAMLCAGYDGTPAIIDDGHLYLPSTWVSREFPKVANICQKIEERVRAHFI